MKEEIFEISNKLGLHARAAALLVQTTNRFKSEIKISKNDQEVNGKSIMGILTLAAEYKSKVKIIVCGDDEEELLLELKKLFDSKFGEE